MANISSLIAPSGVATTEDLTNATSGFATSTDIDTKIQNLAEGAAGAPIISQKAFARAVAGDGPGYFDGTEYDNSSNNGFLGSYFFSKRIVGSGSLRVSFEWWRSTSADDLRFQLEVDGVVVFDTTVTTGATRTYLDGPSADFSYDADKLIRARFTHIGTNFVKLKNFSLRSEDTQLWFVPTFANT